MKKEALFWKKEGDKVRCELCPHNCLITKGKTGYCRVRKNEEGILYSLVYKQAIATHVDPIEKKPLFHFLPGSQAFSVATVGCNFKCRFCQNADISQNIHSSLMAEILSPQELVEMAEHHRCQSISYTYTEPTVFYEYALETAQLAKQKKIFNNFVTNGFINPDPLKKVAPYLDAANVDLKAFKEETYKTIMGGKLKPVLATLKLMKKLKIWIEVTTLLIPQMNDSQQEISQIAKFILTELGPEVPWHISRFYPTHQMLDRPPTPPATIHRAREIGLDLGLRYVYSGNLPGDEGEHTYCYQCGEILIERIGYNIRNHLIEKNTCPKCKTKIEGIF